MDSSKSIQKGQFPLCCNLCETETKINWKCVDCNLLMCHRCKVNIHPKIKSTKNHKVVDIKEVGLHNEEPDFSNLKCIEHKGQGCFMFCKSCDQLVCPQCIHQTHNHGHELVQISEGYVIQVQKLQEEQNKMDVKIDTLEKEEIKLKGTKTDKNEKCSDVEMNIKTQQISLHEAVDTYTENLLKKLDQHKKESMDSFKKEESRLITIKNINKNNHTILEEVINSKDPEKIFKASMELDKLLQDDKYSLQLFNTTLPIFQPRELYTTGSLEISTDFTCRVVNNYTIDIHQVFQIVSDFDSLWIHNNTKLQKVKPEVNNLKVISSDIINICDIAVTPSNDLLLLVTGESVIKQIIGRTGQLQDSVYRTDQLQPTAIHVTSDYKVLIGVIRNERKIPAKGKGAVMSMDKAGKHITTCESDSRINKFIFSYPLRITTIGTCPDNRKVCVVDKLYSDGRGRIVIVFDGILVHTYTGNPDVNSEQTPFKPVSINSSPSGKIIVLDKETHTIHILSSTGHLITYINLKDIDICHPFCTAFTKSGKVYIGCNNYNVKGTNNTKLYEVETTEI